jgi:hypothetical protein
MAKFHGAIVNIILLVSSTTIKQSTVKNTFLRKQLLKTADLECRLA